MNWQDDAFEDLGYTKIREFISEYCLSELASTQALSLHPYDSLDLIRQRSRGISDFVDILEHDDPFPLQRIEDCSEDFRHAKIKNAVLQPDVLLSIARILEISRKTRQYLKERGTRYAGLIDLVDLITAHKSIENAVSGKIDDYGRVKDSASEKLGSIRKQIIRQEAAIREQMEQLTRQYADAGMLRDNRATIRGGRLVMPVKLEYKNKIQGIVHDQSSSGQTFFIEPMAIVEGNNTLKELQLAEQEEIERILRELTAQVGEVADEIAVNQDQVVKLDLLHAMAHYAMDIDGVPAIVSNDRRIELKGARNPVLMRTKQVVPNDIIFGNGEHIILITGPNAGGKTVTLKTAGLLVLMAISGLHIPANEGPVIPLVDAIYIDIGDRQSIEQDLSTFSSHVGRISQIMEHATGNSLVLLDELGTGTDPTEGAALARAILERLLEKGSLAIATTHHGALKAFAHNTQGIINAAMQFNQEDLSPTYIMHIGRPGSSYALEIAGRVGLQSEIIDTARHYLDSSKEALEDLIVQLEKQADELEKEKTEHSSQRMKYENLKREYETKVEKIREEVKKAKQTATRDAQKILDESSRKIEEAIRTIRETEASKEAIKEAKQTVAEQKEKVAGIQQEVQDEPAGDGEPIEIANLHEGDLVYVTQFNKTGTVVDEPKGGDRISVDIGGMRMDVPAEMLREPAEQQRKQSTGKKKSGGTGTRVYLAEDGQSSNRIDLRGQRVDEALANVDRFINQALVHGLEEVEIIHGKGTGALQKAIGEYLSEQKHVKSHRLGELEEGGAGVTIVTLG
ncbi:MAG TPA: endonuclease MutS2 [bacterium]|nr:endonuclease MutS2 [bacterium]